MSDITWKDKLFLLPWSTVSEQGCTPRADACAAPILQDKKLRVLERQAPCEPVWSVSVCALHDSNGETKS